MKRKIGHIISIIVILFMIFGILQINGMSQSNGVDIIKVIPSDIPSRYIDFSSGTYHNLAIASDGTLWAWGGNDYGQLGDGTLQDKTFPTKIGKDNNWMKVSAGENYSLAIKKDGTVWAWGCNSRGQLGDDTTSNRPSPVCIKSLKDIITIDAGSDYSVAIKNDESLWSWGKGKKTPIRIDSNNDWQYINNGYSHTFAIKEDGTLWVWGANGNGQLGFGERGSTTYHPQRVGSDNDWVNAKAGLAYSIAQKRDGTLWMWGYSISEDILSPQKISQDNNWISYSVYNISGCLPI